MAAGCVFYRLSAEDSAEIVALEKMCFATPWTKEQFELAFTQNVFAVFGLRLSETLVAYIAIYHAAGELEILNIATHPAHRRNGYACKLLSMMLQVAARMGIEKAILEVRRSNLPAIRLYERLGFEPAGVRKGYYQDTGEDALVYTRQVPPHNAEKQSPEL
ncbi:ribosomal-protein-alanine acetyltransferase [Oleidesulfovibrio alaskensis G20]|jgi:ribosomal-protein-alanine N-acetyltransferase|uniref:Ribosomal-protein-alanine acetyltransferase n=1 Tax=Oleidesulfovibrio alaskensis (strain ATCC BAA-1058 / DSM 17464 / G20) TaxID=207559 RepID=Q30ZV9_OLEA2|nr:ribosomal protein S18-alanine N-acetyltransferase [Oleidesulfovibrio alaskensis]ABB38787.1 ribosomal-protein-alanine acetyltransferase [Oleidesulfovibrio alaskensis G20]MBG0773091.1 ribosomal protein S18-alanine N-acetyltransferase [Oleidesulfovibrio alaskensis]MBL3582666.1 ribosomal protein S18-alanine N-acetyltransferase [Oleidesulfovibrio alaskensis]